VSAKKEEEEDVGGLMAAMLFQTTGSVAELNVLS
jgi:hypothetical protein